MSETAMSEDTRPRVHISLCGWVMRGHIGHTVWIPRDGRWTFNGDLVRPTFSPSVVEGAPGDPGHHIWVRDGKIEYLSDKKMRCCEGQPSMFEIPAWDDWGDEEGEEQQ